MYKRIEHPLSNHGLSADLLDVESGGALKKVASQTYIPPSLDKAIRDIQAAPDPNYFYLYDRALGAGELYGANNNGDWFSASDLKANHDTFVKSAKLYRHHKNKGPHIGDVMASAYNEKLDTVDLIIRAPKSEIEHDIEKLASGGIIATSMGAKLKHDICSICGQKSTRRSMYCEHLKYQLLKVYPDGRQVFAINPSPRFVDISIVVIPAAPESAVLRKIASQNVKMNLINHTQEAYRGVLNPIIIEKTANLDRASLIKTIHETKGPLRPDEFVAILRKDASLIQETYVPYVQYKRNTGLELGGRYITKLATALEMIPNIECEESKFKYADFMLPEERDMYLSYREYYRTMEKTASMDFVR